MAQQTPEPLKSQDKPVTLRDQVAKIIQDGFEETKKREAENFVSNLDHLITAINETIDKSDKENNELKTMLFKHKTALLTLNGVLLTIMIASKTKIPYSFLSFNLLFFSFVIGIFQFIFFYFKNEYNYISGKNLGKKLIRVAEFCKKSKNGFYDNSRNTINSN